MRSNSGWLFLCVSVNVLATTYYVDPADGSDANAGTSEGAAWKTESKVGSASSGFSCGDTVKFRRGHVIGPDNTTGTMTIAADGCANNPITFTDYTKTGDPEGLPKPILDVGNVAISGSWTEQSANGLPGVYYNNYSGSTFNGLFVNQTYYGHADSITNISEGEVWWNNSANAGYSGTGGSKSYPLNNGYAVGIYYKPLTGVDPSTATHRKASNNSGIVLHNRKYITFQNLHIKGGTYCAVGSGSANDIDSIKFVDVDFSQCQYAATLRATTGGGFAVRNSGFSGVSVDDSGRGLAMETSDGTGTEQIIDSYFENCVFTNMSGEKWRTYGLSTDWESITIQNPVRVRAERNVCNDSAGLSDCIIVWTHSASGEAVDTLVASNKIYNARNGVIFGAGVASPTNGRNKIIGNLVDACDEFGIKLNIGQAGDVNFAAFNTVSECDTSISTQTSQSGWDIKSNLSVNPASAHWDFGGTSTSLPDYNWYYPVSGTQFKENGTAYNFSDWRTQLTANGVPSPDANSIAGTDPKVTDLRPNADSGLLSIAPYIYPCLDADGGSCLWAYDIGAYQNQSVPYGYALKPKARR